MKNKVEIYGFVNINNFGVCPRYVEDNKYISQMIDKTSREWHLIANVRGPSCRERGPAIEILNSNAGMWYTKIYAGRHRIDGPQTIYMNGDVEYWINDKYICNNEKDFIRWKKLMSIS